MPPNTPVTDYNPAGALAAQRPDVQATPADETLRVRLSSWWPIVLRHDSTTGVPLPDELPPGVPKSFTVDVTVEQRKEALLQMQAARARVFKDYPYTATAVSQMMLMESLGKVTFASDARWRMYYDPILVLGLMPGTEPLTLQQLQSAWMHEFGHLLRDAAGRWARMGIDGYGVDPGETESRFTAWNWAQDLLINADVQEMGLPLFSWNPNFNIKCLRTGPDTLVTPAEGGITPDLLTEEVFRIIDALFESTCQTCGLSKSSEAGQQTGTPSQTAAAADGAGSESNDGEPETGNGTAGGESSPSESADAGASGSETGPGNSDTGAGAGEGAADGAGDGNDGAGSNTDGGDGAAGGGGSCRGHKHGGSDPHHDCGSGTGGDRRSWEADLSDGAADGSVDPGRTDLIRRSVAKDVIAYSKGSRGRGTVPGGLVRWAASVLQPAHDWRRELRSQVSRLVHLVVGRWDYSYSRASRRRIPNVVLPGMVAAAPPVMVAILDTSGSMSDTQVGQGLADINAILRAVTGAPHPVRVIMCDAYPGDPQTLRTMANVEVTGGGGTDMGVGIAVAAKLRPRPDVVVVFTDGYTPWPDEPPRESPRTKYIAVIFDATPSAPGSPLAPPAWMHTIYVESGEPTP